MGRHKPAHLWAVKHVGTYPQIYVKTNGPGFITVSHFADSEEKYGRGFTMKRRDARLLAKRINQCLDATK